VGGLALASLFVDGSLVLLVALALLGAALVDARAARVRADVQRTLPELLSRGIPADIGLSVDPPERRIVRQPVPPDLVVTPPEAAGTLEGQVVAHRRGRHVLPAPVVRTTGPLGFVQVDRAVGDPWEVAVYPDLPAARAVAALARQGRVGEGRQRGMLGIGTDFESVRDYSPDDDVRQVNWQATARVGRPMSNQYRVDQDRDLLCLVDTGRLMAAPLGDRTRLDAALDAVTAVVLVADDVGDRCGAVAFDAETRRRVLPGRSNARNVVDALFDVESVSVDTDYDLAFRSLPKKRACVLLFTDLLEPSAARPLVEAMPWLARRHAVIVASCRDPDLDDLVASEPASALEAYRAAIAIDVLDARSVVSRQLGDAGVVVVEADPRSLGAACVAAYLRLKSRALV
jgi:uncharacterized protein (DUF58 family)